MNTRKKEIHEDPLTIEDLEQNILSDYQNEELWVMYLQKMKSSNPDKYEILCLGRNPRPSGEEWLRYHELISKENDKKWIAQFDIFRGQFKELMEITIPLYHYGKAPKKYGNSYRFGYREMTLALRNNWKFVGRGNCYRYLQPPENLIIKKNITQVSVYIPIMKEIEDLIKQLHKESLANQCRIERRFGPWELYYEAGGKELELFPITIVATYGKVAESTPFTLPTEPIYTRRYFRLSTDGYAIRINWESGESNIEERIHEPWSYQWKDVYFLQ